jgi:putative aldouronate transport system permease protein
MGSKYNKTYKNQNEREMSKRTMSGMELSKRNRRWRRVWRNRYLYLLLLPCVVYFLVFHYAPMYGLTIAFKEFKFAKGILGSPWVGWDNFRYLFGLKDFYRVWGNSIMLSLLKLLICFPIPILLSIALNEIPFLHYKRLAQTTIYLPYFISWVVIGGILVNLLSPSWGIINVLIKSLGGEPVFFLGSSKYFRGITIVSYIWKQAGWDTIIYLAAITSINPELYEAATIDGASRLKSIWHVTLPGVRSTIIILLLLAVGNMMNNGFEQINVLQNTSNLVVSEVFETYTYKLGLVNGRFSFATTVGLFSSTVGFVLLVTANLIARVSGEEGIF